MRLVRLARAFALAGTAVIALASGVAAQDTISFAGSDDLSVLIKDGSGKVTVVVVNGGPETTISWSVQIAPADDGTARTATIDPVESTLDERASNTLVLTVLGVSASGKLNGILVGTPADAGAPITRELTISNFGLMWRIDPPLVVIQAIAFSIVVLLFRFLTLNEKYRDKPLRNPKWSFATTWTASFAGAGALLATVVASGSLPTEPYLLSKAEFAGLALLFGALGTLSPMIFSALSNPDGSVEGLHFCTVLSATAVIGQLATIVLLLIDASGQGSSSWLVLILAAMAVLAGALVFVYIWRGIPRTLDEAQTIATTDFRGEFRIAPADWTML